MGENVELEFISFIYIEVAKRFSTLEHIFVVDIYWTSKFRHRRFFLTMCMTD